MPSMMTPKLLTCDEGQIAVLSMYKEKQLDLNKTHLVPTSRSLVLLPFTLQKVS